MLVWVMRFMPLKDGTRHGGYLVIVADKAAAKPDHWVADGYRHAGTHKGVLEDAGALPLSRRLFWATDNPGAGEPIRGVPTTHGVPGTT